MNTRGDKFCLIYRVLSLEYLQCFVEKVLEILRVLASFTVTFRQDITRSYHVSVLATYGILLFLFTVGDWGIVTSLVSSYRGSLMIQILKIDSMR